MLKGEAHLAKSFSQGVGTREALFLLALVWAFSFIQGPAECNDHSFRNGHLSNGDMSHCPQGNPDGKVRLGAQEGFRVPGRPVYSDQPLPVQPALLRATMRPGLQDSWQGSGAATAPARGRCQWEGTGRHKSRVFCHFFIGAGVHHSYGPLCWSLCAHRYDVYTHHTRPELWWAGEVKLFTREC